MIPVQTLSMAPTLPQFNLTRLRSYVFRIPLFTRIILLLILLFWILEFQSTWDIAQWGALVPLQVNISTSMSYMLALRNHSPSDKEQPERTQLKKLTGCCL